MKDVEEQLEGDAQKFSKGILLFPCNMYGTIFYV
jgi:hypothetical protein